MLGGGGRSGIEYSRVKSLALGNLHTGWGSGEHNKQTGHKIYIVSDGDDYTKISGREGE